MVLEVVVKCNVCGKVLDIVSMEEAQEMGCGWAQCMDCDKIEKIHEELM